MSQETYSEEQRHALNVAMTFIDIYDALFVDQPLERAIQCGQVKRFKTMTDPNYGTTLYYRTESDRQRMMIYIAKGCASSMEILSFAKLSISVAEMTERHQKLEKHVQNCLRCSHLLKWAHDIIRLESATSTLDVTKDND